MDGIFIFKSTLQAESAYQAVNLDSVDFAFPLSQYNVNEKTLDICYDRANPSKLIIEDINNMLYIKATGIFTLTLARDNVSQTIVVDRFFMCATSYDTVTISNLSTSQQTSVKAIYA